MSEGKDLDSRVKDLVKNGYYRIWEKGEIIDLAALPPANIQDHRTLSLLIDRVVPDEKNRSRLAEAIQRAFQLGNDKVEVIARRRRKNNLQPEFLLQSLWKRLFRA